jgi:hypothetical protein
MLFRNPKLQILCLGIAILISCKSENKEPDPLIMEIQAFDVGNEQNASDIRIKFRVDAVVDELKVMVIPDSLIGDFRKSDALQVPEERFTHGFTRAGVDQVYSLRLTQAVDVTGEQITDNKEYVIMILLIGRGFNQLSTSSNILTLNDLGIYDGTYEGVLQFDGATATKMGTITIELSYGVYKGSLTSSWVADDPAATTDVISFLVHDDQLDDFILTRIGLSGQVIPRSGTGHFRDDLDLIFSYTSFLSSETVSVTMTRLVPKD